MSAPLGQVVIADHRDPEALRDTWRSSPAGMRQAQDWECVQDLVKGAYDKQVNAFLGSVEIPLRRPAENPVRGERGIYLQV